MPGQDKMATAAAGAIHKKYINVSFNNLIQKAPKSK
jgi:hypothetical protein